MAGTFFGSATGAERGTGKRFLTPFPVLVGHVFLFFFHGLYTGLRWIVSPNLNSAWISVPSLTQRLAHFDPPTDPNWKSGFALALTSYTLRFPM